MSLSFCTNMAPLKYLQQEPLEAPNLFSLNNNSAFLDPFMDPMLETNEIFCSDSYTDLLPYISSPSDNLISFSPEIFPHQEFESYQYPKRQKIYGNNYHSNFEPNSFEGYAQNPMSIPQLLPEIPVEAPLMQELQAPFNYGRSDENSVKKANGGNLSAQSIAARERRRKITEKTQELSKLIPGGHKMNTAEMFHAAYKYIKFLQAQVGVLESMASIHQGESHTPHTPQLQIIVASPTIQEKLYLEEKCLAPKKFVETIASDHRIQSHPSIFDEIHKFLQADDC